MTTYTWPGWAVSRFELRLQANLRVFTSPYGGTSQVLDLMGERWVGSLTLPPTNDPMAAAAREAFFDRLKGMANGFLLWHLRLPQPQGTSRDGAAVTLTNTAGAALNLVNTAGAALGLVSGTPAVRTPVAERANTAVLSGIPGTTYRAGDMRGLGSQLVRVMADATVDVNGAVTVEFQPRARVAIPAGTPCTWNKPTFTAMLKTADTPPTGWAPGYAEGTAIDFIEQL